MKQFFKFFFASMLGFVVGALILFFVLASVIAGMIASGGDDKDHEVKANSVLRISLNYPVPERTSRNPFDEFNIISFQGAKHTGLNDVLKSIRAATSDDKIKGIFLDLSFSPNSYATLEEVRNELIRFRKSGKFIIAYGEVLEEHTYYLASVADKIYLNPAGEMLLNGFSYTEAYLKDMLDKIGVEPQLIRHGKYKAAGEPLIANRMSDENREQISVFTGSMFRHYIARIAEARKLQYDEVLDIADKLKIRSPEDALSLKMIDGMWYRDQVMDDMRKRLGIEGKDEIAFTEPAKYHKTAKDEHNSITSSDKIALIYADGDIVDGESEDGSAGSETLCESISKARKDSAVKAIVLRVNSPGGSALASDVIWREVVLAKKSKPVVVSFGSVAASGGYYIATPADAIVAQPNTVTGSIGVFAVLINAQKLLKDKLGINLQRVNFGQYADLGSPERPLTEDEKAILQRGVDRIYTDFVKKVAEGRKLTEAQVDSIAQGRVWTGEDALKIGLVDELGSLERAFEIAAKKASLDSYRIISLPEQEDPFEDVLSMLGSEASLYFTRMQLGEEYKYYDQLRKAAKQQGMQARMMFDLQIN